MRIDEFPLIDQFPLLLIRSFPIIALVRKNLVAKSHGSGLQIIHPEPKNEETIIFVLLDVLLE
jgi:hypothetical protein